MFVKSLLVWALLLVLSCKAVSTSTSRAHAGPDEDLSKYMYKPKTKTVEESKANATVTSTSPVKFEKQINATVNAVVDSIAISNKRYQSATGFRIMVYSGGSSEEAAHVKKTVYDWSTEHHVYTQYKQPAFRVKVGNFPDRIRAYDALSDVVKIFPNAVIVPDQIEIK